MSLKSKAANFDAENSEVHTDLLEPKKDNDVILDHIKSKAKENEGQVKLTNIAPSRVTPAKDSGPNLPDLEEAVADVIIAGFAAEDRRWDQGTKSWEIFTDHKTRLEFCKLYLAYRHGMPVQRQIKIEASFRDNDEQLLALAKSSPEARRELIRAGVITEQWIEAKAKKLK